MRKVIILDETTKYPITLMGQRAGVCWGAIHRIMKKIIKEVWSV